MLTRERLLELLDYDPETGIFTWKHRDPINSHIRAWNTKWAWTPAGSPNKCCIKIKIDGALYKAHRLAWFYVHGEWPAGILDHRDKDSSNNRMDNLRPATGAQNVVNSPPRHSSSSGVRGVTWRRDSKKWQAAICVNGKSIHLGCYTDKDDAGRAYAAAASFHYGDFAP